MLAVLPLLVHASTNFSHTFHRRLAGIIDHAIPTLVCLPSPPPWLDSGSTVGAPPHEQPLPLLVFGHGFLITAEDYGYLCSELPDAGFAVALMDAEATVPSAVDMGGFAADVEFLMRELQQQGAENGSSLLYGRLAPSSAVFGHSAGGSITFEVAASLKGNGSLKAMAALAPRASGYTKYAADVDVPSLIMVGSQDCASTNGLAPSALPLYSALSGTACKALVVLEGGDHCNFTTPVRGKCSYDTCGLLSKPRQQSLALQLLVPFFRFAFGSAAAGAMDGTLSATPLSSAGSFTPFAQLLERLAAQGAVQYQYVCDNTTRRSERFDTDTCATQCPPKNAISLYKVRRK